MHVSVCTSTMLYYFAHVAAYVFVFCAGECGNSGMIWSSPSLRELEWKPIICEITVDHREESSSSVRELYLPFFLLPPAHTKKWIFYFFVTERSELPGGARHHKKIVDRLGECWNSSAPHTISFLVWTGQWNWMSGAMACASRKQCKCHTGFCAIVNIPMAHAGWCRSKIKFIPRRVNRIPVVHASSIALWIVGCAATVLWGTLPIPLIGTILSCLELVNVDTCIVSILTISSCWCVCARVREPFHSHTQWILPIFNGWAMCRSFRDLMEERDTFFLLSVLETINLDSSRQKPGHSIQIVLSDVELITQLWADIVGISVGDDYIYYIANHGQYMCPFRWAYAVR